MYCNCYLFFSTSHQNFETLLLQKIGTTAAPKQQRRQIKPDAAVVTSEEYIEQIKAREESKKKPSGKRKSSGRTSKSKKIKANENLDPAEEECTDDPDEVETIAEPPKPSPLREKDYILAKHGGCEYVCWIANILSEIHIEVEFLRKKGDKNLYFVRPQIPDISTIIEMDVIRVLKLQSSRRGQCRFSDLSDYPNLC